MRRFRVRWVDRANIKLERETLVALWGGESGRDVPRKVEAVNPTAESVIVLEIIPA